MEQWPLVAATHTRIKKDQHGGAWYDDDGAAHKGTHLLCWKELDSILTSRRAIASLFFRTFSGWFIAWGSVISRNEES